jgi:D-xylonolactonase
LIVAGSTGLHLWRGQDDYRTIVGEYGGERLSFNDIIADPHGQIYAGTYYWGPQGMGKTGKLYLIDTDGSIRIVDDEVKLSNGLGFSRDNCTLYYADSAARCIYRYEVETETGRLKNKRIFVTVPPAEGIPDGLTVDADDCVWCALWYGGQVVRYDPEGNVRRRISLPVKQVSSVTFCGLYLTDLYITTAGEYWPSPMVPEGYDPKVPQGGSLYRIRLDTPGKTEYQANF